MRSTNPTDDKIPSDIIKLSSIEFNPAIASLIFWSNFVNIQVLKWSFVPERCSSAPYILFFSHQTKWYCTVIVRIFFFRKIERPQSQQSLMDTIEKSEKFRFELESYRCPIALQTSDFCTTGRLRDPAESRWNEFIIFMIGSGRNRLRSINESSGQQMWTNPLILVR